MPAEGFSLLFKSPVTVRTLQMSNRWRQTTNFTAGKPWLLRFFDQVRFFPGNDAELLIIREYFPLGHYQLKVEETTFSLRDYNTLLAENGRAIASHVAGNVWKVEVEECAEVKHGDPLVIVESMKMAYAVTPPEIAASARCYAAKAGRCRLGRICRYFLLSNQSAYSTAIVRIMMDLSGHAWV